MNCVIIGYRGTGKSTVGKLLAPELGFTYVSLDEEIVRHAGMSVPEIVATHSWEHFRDIESAVTATCAKRDAQVLDTGGGIVTRPANVQRLREKGIIFLLESTIADIVARIGTDSQRPSLTGTRSFTDEVAEVLAERQPLYHAAAHHTIDTSALSVEEAAQEIAALFRKNV